MHNIVFAGTQYGKSEQYQVALEHTDVVETLKTKKDAEWLKRVPNHGAHRRYTARGNRSLVLGLPETCVITTPEFDDLPSKSMTVALSRPATGLLVQLNSENIEWLRKAVLKQLDEGGIAKRAHKRMQVNMAERVDTDVHNVFWSYNKDKFRAVFACPDDKKRRKQFFTSDRDEAKEFALTGNRPSHDPNSDDDDLRELV